MNNETAKFKVGEAVKAWHPDENVFMAAVVVSVGFENGGFVYGVDFEDGSKKWQYEDQVRDVNHIGTGWDR